MFPLIPLPIKEAVSLGVNLGVSSGLPFPLIPLPIKEAVFNFRRQEAEQNYGYVSINSTSYKGSGGGKILNQKRALARFH